MFVKPETCSNALISELTSPHRPSSDAVPSFHTLPRAIKSMSAMLNPEQDVYDSNGYTTNKHWVSGCGLRSRCYLHSCMTCMACAACDLPIAGPNHVFKNILDAMFKGAYMDMYDSFFLMEWKGLPKIQQNKCDCEATHDAINRV